MFHAPQHSLDMPQRSLKVRLVSWGALLVQTQPPLRPSARLKRWSAAVLQASCGAQGAHSDGRRHPAGHRCAQGEAPSAWMGLVEKSQWRVGSPAPGVLYRVASPASGVQCGVGSPAPGGRELFMLFPCPRSPVRSSQPCAELFTLFPCPRSPVWSGQPCLRRQGAVHFVGFAAGLTVDSCTLGAGLPDSRSVRAPGLGLGQDTGSAAGHIVLGFAAVSLGTAELSRHVTSAQGCRRGCSANVAAGGVSY